MEHRSQSANQLVVPGANGLSLSKDVHANEHVKRIFADDEDEDGILTNEYRRDAVKLEFWLDFTEKNLQLKYENTNRKSRRQIEFLREKQSMYSACFEELCKQFSTVSKDKTKVLYRVMYGFKDIISSLVEYHILQQDKWQRNVQSVKYQLDLRSGRVEELGEDLQALRKEFRELDLQLKSKDALLVKLQHKEKKRIATREEKMKKIEAEIAFRENLRRSVNGLILINKDLQDGFEEDKEAEVAHEGRDDAMFQQYSGLNNYLSDLYENLMKKMETVAEDVADGKDVITALLERDVAEDLKYFVEEAQINTAKKVYMSMKRNMEDKAVSTDDYRYTKEHIDHLDNQLMKSIVDRKNLEEEIERLHKSIRSTQEQMSELESEIHAKRREIDRLNTELGRKTDRLEFREREFQELSAKVTVLSADLKSYIEQNEYLKNLNTNLRAESEKNRKAISDLEGTVRMLKGDLVYEKQQNSRANAEQAGVRNKRAPRRSMMASTPSSDRNSGRDSPESNSNLLGLDSHLRKGAQPRLSVNGDFGRARNELNSSDEGAPRITHHASTGNIPTLAAISETINIPTINVLDRSPSADVTRQASSSLETSELESTVSVIKEEEEEVAPKSEVKVIIPTQKSETILPNIRSRKSSTASDQSHPNIRTIESAEAGDPFTSHGLLDLPANGFPQITRSETSQTVVSDITSFDKLFAPGTISGVNALSLGGTSSPADLLKRVHSGFSTSRESSRGGHRRTSSMPTALAGVGALQAINRSGAYTPPFQPNLDNLRDIHLVVKRIKADQKMVTVVNKIREQHQGRCGESCICQRLLRAGFWAEKAPKAKVLESKPVDMKFQYFHKNSRK